MSPKKKRILPAWMRDPSTSASVLPSEEMGQTTSTSPTHSPAKANGVQSVSQTKRQVNDGLSDDEENDSQQNEDTGSPKDTLHRLSDSPEKVVLDIPDRLNTPAVSEQVSSQELSDVDLGEADALVDKSDSTSERVTPLRTGSPDGGNPVSPSPASSSPVGRKPCFYGSSCYRKNPQHRVDFAHPGDSDYTDSASTSRGPGGSPVSDSRPLCEYGSACYRKNPQHRRDFRHDAPQKRKARPTALQDIPSDNEGVFDASFSSDNYKPSGSESDDSFVTSDSMDSGESDYDPEDDEDDEEKKARKRKTKMKEKKERKKKKI